MDLKYLTQFLCVNLINSTRKFVNTVLNLFLKTIQAYIYHLLISPDIQVNYLKNIFIVRGLYV